MQVDPPPMISYQHSIPTMGISYRFRDKRRFHSKIAKKFHPVFLRPC